MLANVAHEMRNPLNAIRGYTRMIAEGRVGPVTDKQRDFLQVIADNTTRLVQVVDCMMRIVDSRQERYSFDVIDSRRLWAEACSTQAAQLGEKAVRVEETFSEPSLPILADTRRILQLFKLMLDTAIRNTDFGSSLTFAMSRPREGGLAIKLARISSPADSVSPGELRELRDLVGFHGGRLFVRDSEEGTVIQISLPESRTESTDATPA